MPTDPQSVSGRTTARAALTPQLTGLKRAAIRIQCGICDRARNVDDRKSSGRLMKFATAIIVDSRRVTSAIACETPANALFTSIAIPRITSQPSTPVLMWTPRASETRRMIRA